MVVAEAVEKLVKKAEERIVAMAMAVAKAVAAKQRIAWCYYFLIGSFRVVIFTPSHANFLGVQPTSVSISLTHL